MATICAPQRLCSLASLDLSKSHKCLSFANQNSMTLVYPGQVFKHVVSQNLICSAGQQCPRSCKQSHRVFASRPCQVAALLTRADPTHRQLRAAQGNFDFSLDDEVSEDISPSPPPTSGRFEITIDNKMIRDIDLTAAHEVLRSFVARVGDNVSEPEGNIRDLLDSTVGFTINYTRDDPLDPRELSELPDVRVWFVRLDTAYPWLPAVLDWRAGELARYAAMLVPHQMSRKMGIVYNPEAMELFGMKKYFTVYEWLRAQKHPNPDARVKDMMKVLGFTIDDIVYDILRESPPP